MLFRFCVVIRIVSRLFAAKLAFDATEILAPAGAHKMSAIRASFADSHIIGIPLQVTCSEMLSKQIP